MTPQAPAHLFAEQRLRDVVLRNRIGVSPMCMYSADEGLPDDWHLVHLGSRALGGAGLVMAEATAVLPQGRITTGCTGLWNEEQTEAFARIAAFIAAQGAVPAIQLGHAGRKASQRRPIEGNGLLPVTEGGWTPLAPSPIAFDDSAAVPHALTREEISDVVAAFVSSAERAVRAGFTMIEVHAAHGYLIHSFLSPISNSRNDEYGGGLEERSRFLVEIVRAIRATIPDRLALSVRLSCTDWEEHGWSLDDTVWLAKRLVDEGVDLIDCSSGGSTPSAAIPIGPGYQLPLAARVRREAGVRVAAVGMFLEPDQANRAITQGETDLVLLGRESLRDPYWPYTAATELGLRDAVEAPHQYALGWKRRRRGLPWNEQA